MQIVATLKEFKLGFCKKAEERGKKNPNNNRKYTGAQVTRMNQKY